MKAIAFDAYGTLFDVFSVTALGEDTLRSLMGRHRDFSRVTEDALVYTARSLGLDLTPDRRARRLEAYLTLAAFPDVKPGLEALRARGLRLGILSSGEPKMLEAAARSAGIVDLLDDIMSVEEVKIFKPSPPGLPPGPRASRRPPG